MASTTPTKAAPTTTTSGCQLHANDLCAEPALCRYAGKRCFNPRVTKRNGSLHNLCHVHRVRANQNQRRMELKRRISRAREDSASEAAHAALYHAMSSSSSSPLSSTSLTLGMGDIDAHLGWTSAPQQPMIHLSSSQQLLLPDYTLNTFVGSVLSDESLFMDLNGDALAKGTPVHVSNMSIYLQDPVSNSTSAYMHHQQQQSVLEPAYLHQSQNDMWIVPNFLLTL